MSHGPDFGFQPSPWDREKRRSMNQSEWIATIIIVGGFIFGIFLMHYLWVTGRI